LSAGSVDRLIELGRDREAAEQAVRDAVQPTAEEEAPMLGPVEQFDVLIPSFLRVGSAIDHASLEAVTPCDGWVVRDLLEHMNGGARAFAAAFEGRAVVERGLGDDPIAVVGEALAEFDVAIRAPGALEQTVESPFGSMPGEVFARLAALDLLVHTWDLSRATGQDIDVPGAVVESVDGFARQAITDELRRPGVFGREVAASPNGSSMDALAAFTGRRP
jgi:uncharacterized protein (TIGR03086 family)